VGIKLRHGRVLMSKELLQGIEVHLVGSGQPGGVKVPEAVPGPQVFGEARPLLDAVHLLRDDI
jgi:hypothetical protein